MDRIELKADISVGDNGSVEGIAWPYGSADSVGDIIIKGAVRLMSENLPMLRGHNPEQLIGIWDEVRETDRGIYAKGRFNETMLAKGTRSQIKTRQISGLSIGFEMLDFERKGRGRVIKALNLAEISILKHPSHNGARLTGVKSFNQAQALAEAIHRAAAAHKLRT